MNLKAYLTITGIIFVMIAALHLLRLINQWPAQIDVVSIPIWVSAAGLLIAPVSEYGAGFRRSKIWRNKSVANLSRFFASPSGRGRRVAAGEGLVLRYSAELFMLQPLTPAPLPVGEGMRVIHTPSSSSRHE